MRNALALVAVSLLLALSFEARAELWCGRGPGSPLDHPCSDQDTEEDPAVASAAALHANDWLKVQGIWQVSAGTNQTGNPLEIRVFVEPSRMAAATKEIPQEVDDIPVRLVGKKIPNGGGHTSVAKTGQAEPAPYDPGAAERQAEARLAEAVYAETMREYSQQWNDLPGVVGLRPKSCDQRQCDFSAICITVQAQFMSGVKERITNSVNGIPIVFIPYDGSGE